MIAAPAIKKIVFAFQRISKKWLTNVMAAAAIAPEAASGDSLEKASGHRHIRIE